MNKKVIVYTTSLCPVCAMVKEFLQHSHIPFAEVNVSFNPLSRAKLIAKTGKLTTPQTYINGKWVSGFHPEKIYEAWNTSENQHHN